MLCVCWIKTDTGTHDSAHNEVVNYLNFTPYPEKTLFTVAFSCLCLSVKVS